MVPDPLLALTHKQANGLPNFLHLLDSWSVLLKPPDPVYQNKNETYIYRV